MNETIEKSQVNLPSVNSFSREQLLLFQALKVISNVIVAYIIKAHTYTLRILQCEHSIANWRLNITFDRQRSFLMEPEASLPVMLCYSMIGLFSCTLWPLPFFTTPSHCTFSHTLGSLSKLLLMSDSLLYCNINKANNCPITVQQAAIIVRKP